MKIGVIVAMEKELERLKAVLGGCNGTIGHNDITAVKCGVGKVNSAIGAHELIKAWHPDLVVSTGVAGGAGEGIAISDVVVSRECRYHDAYCGKGYAKGQIMGMPPAFTSPESLVTKALSLRAGVAIHAGLIVSGDCFVDDAAVMRGILRSFPDALAVDMESCSIAQTCHINGLPFISFRIISDIPLSGDNTAQYEGFWQAIADKSFVVTRDFLAAI